MKPIKGGVVWQPFHNGIGLKTIRNRGKTTTTTTTKTYHREISERDVSYRLYTHAHPYVGPLTQRLLRGSIRDLQAADTLYRADGSSLPDSVELLIPAGSSQGLQPGTVIVLASDTQATTSGGTAIALSAKMQLDIASAATVTLPGGLEVTLRLGLGDTPDEGTTFAITSAHASVVTQDATVTLATTTAVQLYDGSQATLPAGTSVVLQSGNEVIVAAATQAKLLRSRPVPELFQSILSNTVYNPSRLVKAPYPVKDLDFTLNGAYSVYNWELFYHVPLTIATHLSKNQRYAEARHWLHHLFDPTDDSDGKTPERFWKVRPFQYTEAKKIEEILVNLSTGADPDLRNETIDAINAWKSAPFRPHVIARYRQQSYMYKTVMAYLDNLIAWGDSLFRQDTGEAIDEALMLYVMAANILGPRPQAVPRKGSVRSHTYANLRNDLDKFGNAMRDLEPDIAFDQAPFPIDGPPSGDAQLATIRSLGKALYFGVPRNDKIVGYWDTVADRLFKIRNSLNFQGTFRQLALFEPPIDPAMLARAAAAGLDVGAIVSGLNQPLPIVRFQLLLQKAAELAQEVKSLGNGLLSAMEKEDNEAISLLRAKHERTVMTMAEQVKYAQLQEAEKSKEGLLKSLESAMQRYVYFERQLGKSVDDIQSAIPEWADLDRDALHRMAFSSDELEIAARDLSIDIAEDLAEAGGKIVSSHEVEEMSKLAEARGLQDIAQYIHLGGQFISLLPQFGIKFHFWGLGGDANYGGFNLGKIAQFAANVAKALAERKTYEAGKAARIGSYARRELQWTFESNNAAAEIVQISKQIRAAEIREAIADLDLRNHRQQMKHAEEIEQFLNGEGTERNGKKTNKALYTWMKREVKGLHSKIFQFAFDTAKKAERALQHELGDPDLCFIDYGYLGGKEGLLAGEKLHFDIKRMEMAHLELNTRELELTKSVSLQQIDPLALVQLRETGSCVVQVPEMVFDLDGSGHYFRRIKSVAVSVPSVVGPYSSVNCTLTLLKSSIRKSPSLGDGYGRTGPEDSRFDDYFSSTEAIVTSTAMNDTGLFETNLRDERRLPFEGSGVISEWRLELPVDPTKGDPQIFDYRTISDVILHFRFTARPAGSQLKRAAIDNIKDLCALAEAAGNMRVFSLRHEFPNEWAAFLSHTPADDDRYKLALTFRKEHYPFWTQDRLSSVDSVELLVRSSSGAPSMVFAEINDDSGASASDSFTSDDRYGGLSTVTLDDVPGVATPVEDMTLYFEERNFDDMWIAVRWKG